MPDSLSGIIKFYWAGFKLFFTLIKKSAWNNLPENIRFHFQVKV
jgi:hypothetical protein